MATQPENILDVNELFSAFSIKKPKTSRYPSLKGTDPKFRRNHRHALHGTMKALVRLPFTIRPVS
ncbi:ADP/ATP carrier protein [Colletotrichum tropicale]|nr:ADP/ATP carrier protein [Colletotrichum tropicale]